MRWLKCGGPVAALALAACIGGGVAPEFPAEDGGPASAGNDAAGGRSSSGGSGSGSGSGSAGNGSSSGSGSSSGGLVEGGSTADGGGSDSGSGLDAGGVTEAAATVRYAVSVLPILNNCQSACHGGSGGLTITYTNIVNVRSGQVATLNYITPGDPGHSYLWCKVNPMDIDCTSAGTTIMNARMPPNGPYLAAAELNLIKTWIQQGAQNN